MKRGCCRAGLTPTYAGIVAAMFFVLSCGSASAQDLFVVEDVPVDVTADTAADARERAMEQAARDAFERLGERLAAEPGFGPAPRVSDAMVQNLVEGLEFANEKSSAVRYLADITVRFRPDAVRNLYGRASADEVPARGGPALLVVPVYEMADTRVIWEEFNPWRLAWEERARRAGGMRLLLPEGNAADARALTPQQAATGDSARILALAGDYHATGALVARATLDRAGAAPALNLVVTSFGGVPSAIGLVDRVAGLPGETVDDVSRRGVAKILDMVDEVARNRPVQAGRSPPGSAAASMNVIAVLDSPSELAAIRRRIRAVVTREELVSLSRGKATLRLFHAGDRERLRGSLSRGGIVVTDAPEGWMLALPNSAGSSPTPLSPAPSGGR